ncbi:MAG: fumarylacetoacetate hydrolase family protein [Bacteroidota bacterium]|nr:fumarylacetoacetate hydrolase family protein [Bacteroidota bacterium]
MKTIKIKNKDNEFPVGKILCLGRNYIEHAKEMKAEIPSKPVVFLKPSSAIIRNGENIIIPNISKELHHEVELVIVIGSGGKNIPAKDADDHILGYAVGLDMTLRDVQNEAKTKGLPWTVAKGFDTSAPISDIIEKDKISDPQNLAIMCKVNGAIRQKSSTSNMIFSIQTVIEYLSSIFTLETGDLIFTGTPEGVGLVNSGDIIEAEIEGFIKISHPVITA